MQRKAQWQKALTSAFEKYDVIVLPVLRARPPKIHPVEVHAVFEARVLKLQNTAAVNFAGVPAVVKKQRA